MPHEIDKEALSAYLDEELEAPKKAELDAHLKTCPECSGYLERLGRASADFKKHGLEPKPAPAPAKRAQPLKLALAFAALVIALMAGTVTLKRFMPTLFSSIQGMITGAASSMGSGGH